MNVKWLDFVKKNESRDMRIGAEVGVYTGQDALRICQGLPIKHLYLIDPYQKYEGYLDYPPEGSLKISPRNAKEEAEKLLKPFKDKTIWIFKKFEECSKKDIPESLDFIYIDGNHAYEYVKEDIRLATIFVKEGGIIGGHDYHIKELKRAVDEHVKQYNLEVFTGIVEGQYCIDWYFVKEKK